MKLILALFKKERKERSSISRNSTWAILPLKLNARSNPLQLNIMAVVNVFVMSQDKSYTIEMIQGELELKRQPRHFSRWSYYNWLICIEHSTFKDSCYIICRVRASFGQPPFHNVAFEDEFKRWGNLGSLKR